MPRRPRAAPNAAGVRYAELRARWEARHRDPNYAGGGDWLIDKPQLPLDATPFLATLRALCEVTQDSRFRDLSSWVVQNGLVDIASGHWSRYGTTITHPLTREVCETIQGMIADGRSQRLAIAEAAAEFAVHANSFDAACQAVERVFDEWRRSVGLRPA